MENITPMAPGQSVQMGTNPGLYSAYLGHDYSNTNNHFHLSVVSQSKLINYKVYNRLSINFDYYTAVSIRRIVKNNKTCNVAIWIARMVTRFIISYTILFFSWLTKVVVCIAVMVTQICRVEARIDPHLNIEKQILKESGKGGRGRRKEGGARPHPFAFKLHLTIKNGIY